MVSQQGHRPEEFPCWPTYPVSQGRRIGLVGGAGIEECSRGCPMNPSSYPHNYLSAADLTRLDGHRVGKTFEVRCCYCDELHRHDYGTTNPVG